MVKSALPNTAMLAAAALLIGIVVSVPLGIISALKRNSPIDLIGDDDIRWRASAAQFLAGTDAHAAFRRSHSAGCPFRARARFRVRAPIKHLMLPAVTLATGLITTLTRLIRSSMLEVIREDYVTTARAKGVREITILFRHVLRNALIPVITVLGLNIAWLLGGAVIIEQVFAWPGMGRLDGSGHLSRAITRLCRPACFVSSLIIIVSNLGVDILYTFIDPRIRYS